MERKKILWLCSWYPNRNDPFDGDFVQRHARAAALYNDIHVIALKPASVDEEVSNTSPGLTEQLFYFRKKGGLFKPLDLFHWFSSYKKIIRNYIATHGKPALVHVHVPWNAGLLALWVKRKYGIPFVVTEHWGIYNENVEGPYPNRPFIFRLLMRNIFRNATHLATVSAYIAEKINHYVKPIPFTLIPNVVDTDVFKYIESQSAVFTFLHVSNLDPVKNFSGILEAVALLEKAVSTPFQLVIAGNRDATYVELAEKMGLLNSIVFFRGEISYSAVAQEMQAADAFILNSISENAPCVIAEALCAGLPVVTTTVGGIAEMVHESNAIMVKGTGVNGLLAALKEMIKKNDLFDKRTIAASACSLYAYEVVGKSLNKLYHSVISDGSRRSSL
ncbi:glycosyltransferase [Parasegetibacter sp. NRK P23]|uniref:glycosyltransferase n=1 Tax=Parasegetibacter sp. NRK P23 TaxID=2942999 RepID=UPI002043209D|nr:glycosyltransferase [Parasegetibacter sp. NRK P23]MCM5530658.1 glycosyltransferase [Parasegetibacter sp. NRK P23]